MKKTVIVAPHADDEIIGCFHILKTSSNILVLFHDTKARDEARGASHYFDFDWNLIDPILPTLKKEDCKFFFPDPYFELHPLHRKYGAIGEQLARECGEDVTFYNTNMNAPYIRGVEPIEKQQALNECYPNKSTLWMYDYKYFLFEGQCKWINL